MGGPYPDAGADEVGRVAACSLCGGMAGAGEASQIGEHGPGAIVSVEPEQGALRRTLVRREVARDGSFALTQFLPMSRQATLCAHKAKRREGRQPGKPGRCIWLKREQAVRGAEHHVVPLDPILDER